MFKNLNEAPIEIQRSYEKIMQVEGLVKSYPAATPFAKEIEAYEKDLAKKDDNVTSSAKRLAGKLNNDISSAITNHLKINVTTPGLYTLSISREFNLIGRCQVDNGSCITNNHQRLDDNPQAYIVTMKRGNQYVGRCLAEMIKDHSLVLYNFYPTNFAATMCRAVFETLSKDNKYSMVYKLYPNHATDCKYPSLVYHNNFLDCHIIRQRRKLSFAKEIQRLTELRFPKV